MRNIIFSAALLFLFVSCGDKKSSDDKMLLDSSGSINNVSVVVDNELWNGSVGDAIRNVLTAPIYGLPQDEPMFTISQIPPSVFTGFVTKNRTILKIEVSKDAGMEIKNNVYAQPQKVIIVSGASREQLVEAINDNAAKIVKTFKSEEIAERQRQMAKSPHNFTSIQEKLGFTIQFPSAYRIKKSSDNFFWMSKDITTGTTNLLFFTVPFNNIKRNDSLVNQIIKIRDSVAKEQIKGRQDGDIKSNGEKVESYMTTENMYAPYVHETIIDNKPAIETKGLWDLKADFMGGPFINYAIEDKINKRWVIVEGFAFAPSVEKRNYMLELEAIIKSIKIN
ncbi:uncharacterized protein DUF4837 [Mariniflexile fucanivorans]|uniref:Uncharacterized protein DUF4837 n=1 Tax=Mariniflexile fucanivorans TaxID=264023 RepID=A0A4R1RS07_9FLAO|nr:DUF4837 family protein [Mariniflexile fucanivorans]TCL69248.1 uncharacterized protein DUF4837 [Mariniflexile fucanivorans]